MSFCERVQLWWTKFTTAIRTRIQRWRTRSQAAVVNKQHLMQLAEEVRNTTSSDQVEIRDALDALIISLPHCTLDLDMRPRIVSATGNTVSGRDILVALRYMREHPTDLNEIVLRLNGIMDLINNPEVMLAA